MFPPGDKHLMRAMINTTERPLILRDKHTYTVVFPDRLMGLIDLNDMTDPRPGMSIEF